MRTLASAFMIGFQVTIILTLVGVSEGMLGTMASRNEATGADIVVRAEDSSALSFGLNMDERYVGFVRQQDHVTQATGVLVHPISGFDSITGINLKEFEEMSGGLQFLEGGPFTEPDDLVIDRIFADQRHLHPGDTFDFGHQWRVTGVVEEGKLSRTFADITALQDIFAETGKVSMIYAKVDDEANIPAVIDTLKESMPNNPIYSMKEFTSLFTVSAVPYLEPFINVVIGIAVIGGFLIVFLAMYMAVLERTREIGILKALGASPGYIMGILLREATVLAILGTIMGIGMAYGTKFIMAAFVPNMPQEIVPHWYPIALVIALCGALLGAVYPGFKAARQDAIEALSYD